MSIEIAPEVHNHARDLLDFIDASPSPWHVVAAVEERLSKLEFSRLDETDSWSLKPGGRYYVVRDGSSIIAFVVGHQPPKSSGFRIVGAHTDSPGLRLKPNSAIKSNQFAQLGVEIYGGPILATFTDRDLSLAGRVTLKRQDATILTRLVNFEKPLLRLPNLAIHMNRKVNEEGLRLHKQNELALILSILGENEDTEQLFHDLLAQKLEIEFAAILSWDLVVFDTQKGSFYGPNSEFIANSQLDNLASCHAAITGLLDPNSLDPQTTNVCALFDHEEIGSESAKGADGSFLPDVLERISQTQTPNTEAYKRALANSFLISADMAHAYHPNFDKAYEADHKVYINQGPVIKINTNQRYTSESISEAMFIRWCEQTNTPWQKYSHRSDIPCGSTIGPMTSARLGIRSVDVGCPMWAMHSARESAGVIDHSHMTRVLTQFFSEPLG